MAHKASVSIYAREMKYDDNSSCPIVPNEVFEAAKRAIQSKGTEIVRSKDGFFIVSFSETGPFADVKDKDWLPVKVVRLKQWTSGGLKISEMAEADPNWQMS